MNRRNEFAGYRSGLPVWLGGIFVLCLIVSSAEAQGVGRISAATDNATKDMSPSVRIATFNVSLYGKKAGEIRERLTGQTDLQAKRIAAIVQQVRPDILLVNELDFEPGSEPAKRLAENYFAVAQQDPLSGENLRPVSYPYYYSAPSNTGVDSTLDLNGDGRLGSGNDAWGYGVYPGQYAMTVYSRFPIQTEQIRSFQKLKWKMLPDAIRPADPTTGTPFYDDATWNQLRLSSKNHLDVPVEIGDQSLHVLASHPTPPVFDGPEDRNGARNHDEIQFWVHYLDNASSARDWMVDDRGKAGGLESQSEFVVMGDLNADPVDGSGRREAINALLSHQRTKDIRPAASEQDAADRKGQYRGSGPLRSKTADFGRNGLMRVDFVIPSASLRTSESGIFWPAKSNPKSEWLKATDHRLVWIDIEL